MSSQKYQLVVMGASAGGVEALKTIFSALPVDFSLPIMVVLHRLRDTPGNLAVVLGRDCPLPVQEAQSDMPFLPGNIYLAPANYHLLIEADHSLSLSVEEPVCHSRPSVDVLFESAALAFGEAVIGVLLTGGNSDGARGLHFIHQAGGFSLVEDPASAKFYAMPEAALQLFSPDLQCHLSQIAVQLVCLTEMLKGN